MEDSTARGLSLWRGNTAVPEVFRCGLVLLTFLVPGALLVLSVQHLVFFSLDFRDTASLDVFELVLLILGTTALVSLWTAARRPGVGGEERFLKLCSTGHGFLALVCLLAALSLIYPVFNMVAIATCFESGVHVTAVLRFCLNVLTFIFVILQTLFFIFNMKDFRCTTKMTMTSVMVLVSTNACLCIRCLADAVQQTMINNNSHNETQAWGWEFCTNQGFAITEGYRIVDKYFYTFILFYCLYSMEVLCSMWGVLDSGSTSIQNAVGEYLGSSEQVYRQAPRSPNERTPLLRSQASTTWERIRSIYVVGICKYSFITSAVVCIIIAGAHTILDIMMKEFEAHDSKPHGDIAFIWIQTVYENFVTGAAFGGLLLVSKEPFSRSKLHSRHTLLLASACVVVFMDAVEAVDAIGNMAREPRAQVICLFLFRTVFRLLGTLFQVPFVIKTVFDTNSIPASQGSLIFHRNPSCCLLGIPTGSLIFLDDKQLLFGGIPIHLVGSLTLKSGIPVGSLLFCVSVKPCKSSDMPNIQHDTNKYVYIRGILWFLAFANLERSLVNTFLMPVIVRYSFNVEHDFIGTSNMFIITRSLFPMVSFYALQSSLLCFENVRNMAANQRQRPEDNVVA